jgi:hypothetical protein
MCEYPGIEYEAVRAIGTKAIDSLLFKHITGFKGRTNQDMRDAGMLVYGYDFKRLIKGFDSPRAV